jgi:hypothetical protein
MEFKSVISRRGILISGRKKINPFWGLGKRSKGTVTLNLQVPMYVASHITLVPETSNRKQRVT